jgi:cation diffusion facilitator CzcD-associated flavoprotein CzcO
LASDGLRGVTESTTGERRHAVVIVGAGFGGLCMAIRLKQAGMNDFVVLEKADEVGGTWRENTYPGCGCDVMSLMYSYSFAPNREWTRMYARQEEILDYIRRTVDDYGVRSHIRFGSEVTGYEFDEAADEWEIQTSQGPYRGRVVVAGPGPLHVPHVPDLPGLSDFGGTVFHSAEWDHSCDLTGKRVAVIGTGASAVQFVPQIAKTAAHVTVLQRTPHWLIPKLDRRLSGPERWLFRNVPGVQKAYRYAIYWSHESSIVAFMNPRWMKGLELIARRQLERQVKDPDLRRRLTPDYTIGCKRILISSDYYPALQRPNVDLVTSGISEITSDGIRTDDGESHPVDAIVMATGFEIGDRFADEHLVGRGGLRIQDAWKDGMEAHLGVAVHGFPNLFLLMGPNSGGGNQSIVFVIEAQVRYILGCLRMMERAGATRIEVRRSIQREFNRWVHRRLAGSVWNAGGCDSWYLDDKGVNRAAWPGSSASYWRRMRAPDHREYELTNLASHADEDTYQGPATLLTPDEELPVQVHLSGHLQPIDGSFHWYGRITADDRLATLSTNQIQLRIADGPTAPARLAERDPWGNTRVTGTGPPPYPLN